MNELHFAVSVGINEYPAFDRLNYAVGDAEKFDEWVRHAQGGDVPDGNAELVTSPEPLPDEWDAFTASPRVDDVLTHLRRFREQVEAAVAEDSSAWDRTRLYLFCSGHGIAPAAQDAALLAANSDRDNIGLNLPCKKLQEWFQEAQPFRELVFLADCCRKRIAGAPEPWIPWPKKTGDRGNVRWLLGCATYFGDLAFEGDGSPDERRGYFTSALLDGLRGAAAEKETGRVMAYGLADYVQRRVQHATEDRLRPQRPTMPAAEDFLICRVDEVKLAKFNIKVVFPDNYQGQAELRKGREVVPLDVTGDGGRERTLELEEGIYQAWSVEPPDGPEPFTENGKFVVVKEGQHVEL